jgi:hypothetical protein
MKLRFVIFFVFLLLFFDQKSQTVFWMETFNNGCTSGCGASGVITGTNGAWSVDLSGGCNDFFANMWYISCAENGNAVGTCGSGCGSNATLHMGSTTLGDIGAAYDAGGFGGCGSGGTTTYARAVSPNISTLGKSGITISFNYLENGAGAVDDGWVEYSLNGGTSWALLINTAKTLCCGGACTGFNQGKWTSYTSATIAGASNIANFRLRFVWQNNDDGIGTDPSYAINDLKIMYATILPIELESFSVNQTGTYVQLQWTSSSEKNFLDYEVQRSKDGTFFSSIGTIKSSGNSENSANYNFTDSLPLQEMNYYRLKMIDRDDSYKYSGLLAINADNSKGNDPHLFINAQSQLIVSKYFIDNNDVENLSILTLDGKKISEYAVSNYIIGETAIFPGQGLQSGVYLCQLSGASYLGNFKIVVIR